MKMRDWSKGGHLMKQVSGSTTVYSKEDSNKEPITKVTYKLVTQENKKGDLRFKRYAWMIPSQPKAVLIQFIGNEKLSSDVYHGNSKVNFKPRINLLPSVGEEVRTSENKPAMTYEKLKMAAGATSLEQRLYSPSSKAQVKNLQRNLKVRRGDSDVLQCLVRLSQEYPDMKLLSINPSLLVVQIDPQMQLYVRHLLKNVSWTRGGGLQAVSYDTQFKVIVEIK